LLGIVGDALIFVFRFIKPLTKIRVLIFILMSN